MPRLRASYLVAFAVVLPLGGCGALSTATLGSPPASQSSLQKSAAFPDLPKLAANTGHSSQSPTETYAVIARGATSCWFGAGGPLKKTHMFYADADPPSSGGKAEIAVLERDPTAPSMRGGKAYRVNLSGEAGGTKIELTNHKLPDALAAALAADIHRFSDGDVTCAQTGLTAQVSEPVPVAQEDAKAKKQKAGSRSARAGG